MHAYSVLEPHGLQPSRLLRPWTFPRQEYWKGLPFPSPTLRVSKSGDVAEGAPGGLGVREAWFQESTYNSAGLQTLALPTPSQWRCGVGIPVPEATEPWMHVFWCLAGDAESGLQ